MPEFPPHPPSDEPPSFAPGENRDADQGVPALPAALRRPQSATDAPARFANRLLSLLVAVVGVSALAVILLVCTAGNVAALLIAGGVFAFGAVHYLIWGWWLGGFIRRQEQDRGKRS
jgi:hypothetical protein